MIEFTTSKGSFIAVPDVIHYSTFRDKIAYLTETCAYSLTLNHDFEIIGLSSDILKDEVLASKVCECGLLTLEYHEFQSICEMHNITGNNLIIKKL